MTVLAGSPKAVLTPAENGTSAHSVEPAPFGPPVTWVGPAPWLAFSDELTSYAVGSTIPSKVAWQVSAVSGLNGTLTVTRSATYDPAAATSIAVYVHDIDVLTTPGASLDGDALVYGNTFNGLGTWDHASRTFDVTPEMTAAAAAGRLIVVALIGVDMRLSLLRVEGDAGVPPLRLMQRGDGLGMGSGRVFGAGTRQGSIRVFGSL